MPEKDFEEKGGLEAKKTLTRKLNKFLNDYFKWVIVLAVLAVLIFGFFFLIMPKYVQTTRYVGSINEQEKIDLQAKIEELSKIKELISAYAKIDQQYIDKVSAIAPIRNNKEELFSEINYLVNKNQLLLQSMSLGDVTGYRDNKLLKQTAAGKKISENIEEITINLFVRGTNYESFKNLLSTLENNLRLMDVLSVNFDPVGKTTWLTIDTYYVKQ